MVNIKIKILDDSIPVPKYAHKGDAGIDLYSTIDTDLKPFERKMIPTGISLSIPDGYAGFVQPRSGLAHKNGITLLNSPGLIDSGYRGEICAIIINLDPIKSYSIKKGNKICQLVFKKVENANIEIVDDLDDTIRGSNGFGSTGI